MEIYLAAEHAYALVPSYSIEVARDRIDQKKVGLVVGTVGALFSNPKPDDIKLLSVENRVEPFWVVAASMTTRYDKSGTYTIPASGPDVREVTMLDQVLPTAQQQRGTPALNIPVVEHCVQTLRMQQAFDALSGTRIDAAKHLGGERVAIDDVAAYAPEGVLVVPPQIRASAVVRQVTAEVVRPVQGAQSIQEERVEIELVDLCFRPVYAFEYEWAARNKRMIIEFDALTGDQRSGGRKLEDQIKGILTTDVLFDITADAVGMFVPGGSIAVKLVKAVVDRGR
ncbi:MAG TPA: hypothetical protein PKC19_23025 [Roseiflexaceae bacterium]|nr:hypothetical protein [Roseiflexaceae bacterium]